MSHLPSNIIELLKARKLATSEAHYFMSHFDMTPYDDEAVDGVTVVMVVFHTGGILFDAIARVLTDPKVNQFIIIDNGSSEKVEQKLRELETLYDHVLVVQGQGNIGFARAANLGAHLASERWVVFLNPDAMLRPDCIEKLVDAARGQPSPCLVGARVLNPDYSEQRGARRGEVTPITTLLSLTQFSRYIPFLKKFEIHREADSLPDIPQAVPTISGACFAVAKRDFALLRGFDTQYFLHVEDVDLCWRAREMGGVVLFHPGAEVVHEGHTSRVEPVFVEWNKGKGLIHYFHKRAQGKGLWRKVYVWLLSPLIIGVSVMRALTRTRLKSDEDDFPGQ
ncbi:glycosyltransferase family 2 protein [Asticcacaulis sp. EMRT-3]|uniref:glycosyltransferase family 2 protein n=1 Tax=Asticcacaulis sp. EMRT-3 TaxID=3040349 RepID=UPI0024AFC5B7|nr:glycosyltransferase family 2 protein [Asticcacaulis sp. EMRT-3]MDI7773782.1 glycosyltransferase family 2 protein [Asticcacaulis sp. EMRT-3]